MNDYRIDYLSNHKEWKICQGNDMYHFNTDTCLLGEYIKIKPNESVLDVGTNNGALLVYLHYYKARKITGIEINKKALRYARMTLKLNKIHAKLINKDFTKYHSIFKYDVIVSNPPYFADSNVNNNANINLGRHESSLTLDSLFLSIDKNLKKNGRVYLVHRYEFLDKIKDTLSKYNFKINDIEEIESKKNVKYTVLLEIGRCL